MIILAAKVGDEIFKRIDQPAIIGEILAGVLVGPAVLGWVEVGETVEIVAELGAVFLLFWVGLETKLDDLREVGRTAGLVGLLGVVLPFVGGAGLAAAVGEDLSVVVFMGAALVATSVGIRRRCSRASGSCGHRRAGRSSAPRSSTTSSRC